MICSKAVRQFHRDLQLNYIFGETIVYMLLEKLCSFGTDHRIYEQRNNNYMEMDNTNLQRLLNEYVDAE